MNLKQLKSLKKFTQFPHWKHIKNISLIPDHISKIRKNFSKILLRKNPKSSLKLHFTISEALNKVAFAFFISIFGSTFYIGRPSWSDSPASRHWCDEIRSLQSIIPNLQSKMEKAM